MWGNMKILLYLANSEFPPGSFAKQSIPAALNLPLLIASNTAFSSQRDPRAEFISMAPSGSLLKFFVLAATTLSLVMKSPIEKIGAANCMV